VKQDLSELVAVYFTFSSELEEQSKQLLEKVEQASCSLNGHRGDEVQSEYLSDTIDDGLSDIILMILTCYVTI